MTESGTESVGGKISAGREESPMAGEKLPMAKMKVPAEVCSYVDDEHSELHLEISIPGVKREEIRLKMQEDSFSLSAPRDNFEYATTMAFCCPVKTMEARANYNDGLLKLRSPSKLLWKRVSKCPSREMRAIGVPQDQSFA
jgi:HSP20 family protein